MDDNQLSMLRYSLKQCEKSYRDACDNPRYWEQAFLNSQGLLDQLPNLPIDERSSWETKLDEWLPQLKAGANRAVGERILRRINADLASAADKLAEDSDPSDDLERLARDLAHPDTLACVAETDRSTAAQALTALQAALARKAAEHQGAAAADRIDFATQKLGELEATVHDPGDGVDTPLARVVAGNLETAQAEIDRLPAEHAERQVLQAQLQLLRQRLEAL